MKTDCTFTQNDLGKNLYTKKTYYTVMIEQHAVSYTHLTLPTTPYV